MTQSGGWRFVAGLLLLIVASPFWWLHDKLHSLWDRATATKTPESREFTVLFMATQVAALLATAIALGIYVLDLFDAFEGADLVAHLAAGVALGGLWYGLGDLSDTRADYLLTTSYVLTLLTSVLWEVGEFIYWDEPTKFDTFLGYVLDTTSDILFVWAGAGLLILIGLQEATR